MCRRKDFIGDVVSDVIAFVPDDVEGVSDDAGLVPDGTDAVSDGTILQWLTTEKYTLVSDGTGCVPDGTVDAAGKKFSLFDVLFISRIILMLFR